MTFTILKDLKKHADAVNESIKKHGYASEHNYYHLMSHEGKDCKPAFASFPDNKGIMFLIWDDHQWQLVSEVLSPEDERVSIFLEFAKYAFTNGVTKIFVEFDPEIRKSLLSHVRKNPGIPIKIGKILESYRTPVISLKNWDPELKGSDFSKIRKAKNRFFRNYNVEIASEDEAKNVSYEELERLVHNWKDNRKNNDRPWYQIYTKFFKDHFPGSCAVLVLKLDGKVSGVASAIPVPNSDKIVYFDISLHDYSIAELGDFLNVLFFDKLKLMGYEYVDFGSSDEGLYNYKKKFKPVSFYKKVYFCVRKK